LKILTALKSLLGRSPLTDPRSVASSLLVHAALLAAASLAVLSTALPEEAGPPRVLRGEIDPVDNRANAQTGGGSPGALGGEGILEALPSDTGSTTPGSTRDATADALLAEILPAPAAAETLQRALPGPQTTGVGVVPGPGLGGGGGSGGGSGGGIGRGVGPGTEFFGAREHAGSFAYVIDSSGSMATRGSLDVAKRELTASMFQLPPDAQFAVIFYNLRATIFTDPRGRQALMPATTANKARAQSQLRQISAEGGTDHMTALRKALTLKPEVLFFLTDADLMTEADVNEILAEAGKTRIQAVRFGLGANLNAEEPLRRLATTTGGTYRYIDVLQFPKPIR
jgi:hypothetical protein